MWKWALVVLATMTLIVVGTVLYGSMADVIQAPHQLAAWVSVMLFSSILALNLLGVGYLLRDLKKTLT